jgi:hypothetical protein
MNDTIQTILWHQFGAAIQMLENAIDHCPEEIWSDQTREPQFWYLAFHTLFWLDCYLSESPEGFAPPAPFGLEEFDPFALPDRAYTKTELLNYLEHGRKKCRAVMDSFNEVNGRNPCQFDWLKMSVLEKHLYNMRHVQHHAAQLHLLLRQRIDAAPRWVSQAASE